MKNLHLFSIKNKLHFDKYLNLQKNTFSYKCFFVLKNKIIFLNNEKFYLESNNLEIFVIKKSSTYILAKEKNTLIVGFSITLNKLKTICNNMNFSLISFRDSIRIASKNITPYISALYSLNNWKENNKYCSKCGKKNIFLNLDNSLTCINPHCNSKIFPRIDPTVIILIQYKDKILLARNKDWKENLYSCIAGFCEPNESLEQTVYRETFEEVGLRLKEANYLFSQFWPFSNNLMVGFKAIAEGYKIKINKFEIEDAIWVSKNQLLDLKKKKNIILPRKYAIAYSLIDYWLNS